MSVGFRVGITRAVAGPQSSSFAQVEEMTESEVAREQHPLVSYADMQALFQQATEKPTRREAATFLQNGLIRILNRVAETEDLNVDGPHLELFDRLRAQVDYIKHGKPSSGLYSKVLEREWRLFEDRFR